MKSREEKSSIKKRGTFLSWEPQQMPPLWFIGLIIIPEPKFAGQSIEFAT